MDKKALPYFESHSEPIAARIATGLHKVGLAVKQQSGSRPAGRGCLRHARADPDRARGRAGRSPGQELRDRLALTLPTISDSAGALVQKGLVTKEPDPRHPRASLLTLTEQGRAGASARALGPSSWPTRWTCSRRRSRPCSSRPS